MQICEFQIREARKFLCQYSPAALAKTNTDGVSIVRAAASVSTKCSSVFLAYLRQTPASPLSQKLGQIVMWAPLAR